MRSILGLLTLCFGVIPSLFGQNEFDALRYSTIGSGGTARTMGMAGSFSAIGADAAAVMTNPAGIATFRRSEFNVGAQFQNTIYNADYLGENLREARLNFNIPSINYIKADVQYDASGKPRKKGLSAVCYGFHVNRLATFGGSMAFQGNNRFSSVTDFFAEVANRDGNPSQLVAGSLPSLAYDAWVIDYDRGGTGRYTSAYRDSIRNSDQTGEIVSRGAIYEYQGTVGLNFSNKVMLGLGLLYSSLRYSEDLSLLEQDRRKVDLTDISTLDMASLDYQSKFTDRGGAWAARVGVIVRPTEQLRLAASVHTPRTYTVNSEYGYSIAPKGDPGSIGDWTAQYNDPLNTYKYKITTPSRFNAGIGFVIQKAMLINADFEFYNYGSARLRADDVFNFNAENSAIRRNYRNVTNVRIGAEWNVPNPENKDQAYRFRAGFGVLPSPYNPNVAGLNTELKKANTVLSCGFGLRDKDYYFDFALSSQSAAGFYTPYPITDPRFASEDQELTYKRNRVFLTFTLGLNLDY
jgi:long-subunit fatty acid transport protein